MGRLLALFCFLLPYCLYAKGEDSSLEDFLSCVGSQAGILYQKSHLEASLSPDLLNDQIDRTFQLLKSELGLSEAQAYEFSLRLVVLGEVELEDYFLNGRELPNTSSFLTSERQARLLQLYTQFRNSEKSSVVAYQETWKNFSVEPFVWTYYDYKSDHLLYFLESAYNLEKRSEKSAQDLSEVIQRMSQATLVLPFQDIDILEPPLEGGSFINDDDSGANQWLYALRYYPELFETELQPDEETLIVQAIVKAEEWYAHAERYNINGLNRSEFPFALRHSISAEILKVLEGCLLN